MTGLCRDNMHVVLEQVSFPFICQRQLWQMGLNLHIPGSRRNHVVFWGSGSHTCLLHCHGTLRNHCNEEILIMSPKTITALWEFIIFSHKDASPSTSCSIYTKLYEGMGFLCAFYWNDFLLFSWILPPKTCGHELPCGVQLHIFASLFILYAWIIFYTSSILGHTLLYDFPFSCLWDFEGRKSVYSSSYC